MPEFDVSKVATYSFSKHNILPGCRAKSIEEVARNIIGIHSARLPTPFVLLHTRLEKFQVGDLHRELLVSRNLIKLRCMRKTLHTITMNLAPIVHQATLRMRLADCFSFYKRNAVPEQYVSELREAIIELTSNQPVSSKFLLQQLELKSNSLWATSANVGQYNTLIRMVIKHLWEDGSLCYINNTDCWESEIRLYGSTEKLYPSLNLNEITVDEAQVALVYLHIAQYGPVTEKDICWWSGLGSKVVRKCISKIQNKLSIVNINGFKSDFYMIETDVDNLINFTYEQQPWLALLAYEDSSLKGYFESRSRYISPKLYHYLFNSIGESRASIMLNGQVVGIWQWNKQQRKIEYFTFEPLSTDICKNLQMKICLLEDCLKTPLSSQITKTSRNSRSQKADDFHSNKWTQLKLPL